MDLKVRNVGPFLSPRDTRHTGSDMRQIALSQIAAWLAADEQSVIDFRANVLNGKLVKPARLEQWITKQSDIDAQQLARGIGFVEWIRPDEIWTRDEIWTQKTPVY